MARVPPAVLVPPLVVALLAPIAHARAQVPGAAGHAHLTDVACVDVPPGARRTEFGCFNVGVAAGLRFDQTSVYWHLRAFPSRAAAQAAKSATGLVVEEDGRVWLSEFGPRNAAPRGGEAVAVVGPLHLSGARPTPRCSHTPSCGLATGRGCIHTRAPKAGTCWRARSVWRRRPARTGRGPGKP